MLSESGTSSFARFSCFEILAGTSHKLCAVSTYRIRPASAVMFAEAFSPSGWTTTSLLPIIRCHRIPSPLSFCVPAVITNNNAASATITTFIEYNETSQHHIVTIPPRIIINNDDDDNRYPSPLHRIHIQPFLSDNETYELLELARDYATENESWEKQDSSRHVSYPTVDFAIEESR